MNCEVARTLGARSDRTNKNRRKCGGFSNDSQGYRNAYQAISP